MTTTPHGDPDGSTTAVLPPVGRTHEPGLGDRLADAGARVRHLDLDARLAWIGAGLTTLAFLVLPYSGSRGPAAEIGGRMWWRPILAIAAAALVTAASRRLDAGRLAIAGVAVASAAATEAGLFAIVSRGSANLRVGFFLILAGTVLVLVAAVRAAARRCAT